MPSSYSTSYHLDCLTRLKKNPLELKTQLLSLNHISDLKFVRKQDYEINKTADVVSAPVKLKYKRNYDIIKQILQKIKIQFMVVLFFIIFWLPLFITAVADARF